MLADARETTKVEQVMALVRQRIERRALVPGARLTSVRAMAESSGFSKSTIVEAYDRLAAEGVIRARPGSGFYVAAPLAPLSIADLDNRPEQEIDPLWMLRQSLVSPSEVSRPGCGWLPDSWMPVDLLRKGLRGIARTASAADLTAYSSPMGSDPFRRLIARRLADQGIEAGPDQILLTDSSTQAIDLVCRFLIEPGDTVLVDDPCYFNFQALLRAHRAKPVGVPFTPHGPDIAAFERVLTEHSPRLYITNGGCHNPTGATLSAPVAHRILKLAEAHDLLIAEDDIYTDFENEPAPRYAAFDGLDRVIRVGSFSKSLSSATRCGHIAARPDWIAALTDLRIATSVSGSPILTDLAHAALTDGSYRRHVERVRARLEQATVRTIARLRPLGIRPWTEPRAGLFLWAKLPDGVDAADLTRRALADNVILAPGNVFSVSESAGNFMRFNVAWMDDDRVYRALARALG